jgi:hypothetical protein
MLTTRKLGWVPRVPVPHPRNPTHRPDNTPRGGHHNDQKERGESAYTMSVWPAHPRLVHRAAGALVCRATKMSSCAPGFRITDTSHFLVYLQKRPTCILPFPPLVDPLPPLGTNTEPQPSSTMSPTQGNLARPRQARTAARTPSRPWRL